MFWPSPHLSLHCNHKKNSMSKKDSFKRYHLIIGKLRGDGMDYNTLMDSLRIEEELQGYKYAVSKRTFARDIEDISSIFDINILYDKIRKVYYIDSDTNKQADNRLFEAYDTLNALSINNNAREFIHFENRSPKGTEHFHGLLYAIKNRKIVQFDYLKQLDTVSSVRNLEALGLKEYRSRWYVVGNEVGSTIVKTFCLDRISDLCITNLHFYPLEGFNLRTFFYNVFGVTNSNGCESEEVILSFTPKEGRYIKAMPLHETQEVLIDNEKEIRVKLDIYPTYEFMMEILSMGSDVKVLAPEIFRKHVVNMLKNTIAKYDK